MPGTPTDFIDQLAGEMAAAAFRLLVHAGNAEKPSARDVVRAVVQARAGSSAVLGFGPDVIVAMDGAIRRLSDQKGWSLAFPLSAGDDG